MNVSSWSIRNPIAGGAAVHHADAGRPDGLPGDEDPELPGHRPADGHRHGVAARRVAGAAGDRGRAQDRELGRHAAGRQAHLHARCRTARATITVEFRLEKPTAGSGRRRARRGRARALRPARRPARPGDRQDGPRRLADPDLHGRVERAWTTRRCPGSSTTRSRKALLGGARRRRGHARRRRHARGARRARPGAAAGAERDRRPTSRASCARSSRRPRAAAPTSAAPSSRCARSPPCSRPTSWPRSRSRCADGRRIRLDQVATRQRHASPSSARPRCSTASRWSASRSSRTRGAGEVEVADGVRAALEELKAEHPDISVTEAFNFVDPVRARTTTAR